MSGRPAVVRIVAQSCSLLLMLLAVAVAIGNGWTVRENARRRRDGGTFVSPIPLLTQLAVLLAFAVSALAPAPWLPAWSFWAVALSDVSLWLLAMWGARWTVSRFRNR